MRRWLTGLFIGLGWAMAARAEIPAELVLQFSVPAAAGWDVQYLFDDSTLWQVYAVEDSIVWTDGGGSRHVFIVPDAIYHYQVGSFAGDTTVPLDCTRVSWLRWPETPDAVSVFWSQAMLVANNPWYYDHLHLYCIFNLLQENLVDSVTRWGSGNGILDYKFVRESRHQAWPALPNTSTYILFSQDEESWHEGLWSEVWRNRIRLFLWNIGSGSGLPGFDPQPNRLGGNPEFFRATSAAQFAFRGYDDMDCYVDDPDDPSCDLPDSTYIGVGEVGTNAIHTTTAFHTCALAQTDADGTCRIIAENGHALEVEDFDLLWHNPAIGNAEFCARLVPGTDEVIFSRSGDRYRAYRGRDGLLLDSLAALAGEFSYVLRREARSDAIVTRERLADSTRTVRVYQLSPPPPWGLLCRYAGDPLQIMLEWPDIPGAAYYELWAATDADNFGERIALLAPTVGGIGMAADQERRFFHLIIGYGEPPAGFVRGQNWMAAGVRVTKTSQR